MGELWRSQDMQLIQLFVQIEAAHATVEELGKLGVVQFRDLNDGVNAFQRNFVSEVKRTDEMERKLKYFADEIDKDQQTYISTGPINGIFGEESELEAIKLDELEQKLEELESELKDINSNQEELNRTHSGLVELQYVLHEDSAFFDDVADFGQGGYQSSDEIGLLGETPMAAMGGAGGAKLGFVTGVVDRSRMGGFERVLWRALRGNLYMKQAEIEELIQDPKKGGEPVEKNVVIIFYQGERAETKIRKICESFGANLYMCPDNAAKRHELEDEIHARLTDLDVVLSRTTEHKRSILQDININLSAWSTKVMREKAIYDTMNLFNYDIGRKCLIAEGWCPVTATEQIQLALRSATSKSGALVPSILSVINSKETPPTYFKTNKVTRAFQEIVNAYGIPRYREINPATFSIVTFPFLFAVMFGDVGHGICLLLFSIWMVVKEKKLSQTELPELLQMPFDGRYVMLLMSIFSLYTGMMYNEFFSISMDWFGSSYSPNMTDTGEILSPDMIRTTNNTYPFGVDPAWKGAANELNYYNSLKMKMSIVLGVIQMVLGIILSGMNARNDKKKLDFIFEFLPGVIFMNAIFGYLVVLIFVKWAIPLAEITVSPIGTPRDPPSILKILIQMFLSPGSIAPSDDPTSFYVESQLFPGQFGIQVILVIVALICVPLMLLPKPFILKKRHEELMMGQGYGGLADEDEDEEEEEFDFSEIFIHQVIHTVEFVLGSISNTASYLRLWALSLAHSELATVFYERIFLLGLGQTGSPALQWIFIFCTWAVWAALTFAVILVMESLSAFLHGLRLHWVEFQNKFFRGDGVLFRPFNFSKLNEPID